MHTCAVHSNRLLSAVVFLEISRTVPDVRFITMTSNRVDQNRCIPLWSLEEGSL